MFSLHAYYELVDPGGAFNAINAVQDQSAATEGTALRVPDAAPFLLGVSALVNDASVSQVQVASPSLRAMALVDVEPVVVGSTYGEPPEVVFHATRPYQLKPGEALEVFMNSDPAAAAHHYGLVWLGDGPQRATEGTVFTVRCVGQNVGAHGAWTLSSLVFDQRLPVGRYAIVGMRVRSLTAVAARLVIPSSLWRPGVPVVNAITDEDVPDFRYGQIGTWGEFHTNLPPQMEILGPAGSVPVVLLDILQVGA